MIKAIPFEQIDSEVLTPDGGIRLDRLEYFMMGMSVSKAGPMVYSVFMEEFLRGKYANGYWDTQKNSSHYQNCYERKEDGEKKITKRKGI